MRIGQRLQHPAHGTGLQTDIVSEVNSLGPLVHQFFMAGQQALRGQVRVLDVESIGTAQQGDPQFPGGILDLVEGDAAAAGRGIFVGDAELLEGEDVMEEQDLALERSGSMGATRLSRPESSTEGMMPASTALVTDETMTGTGRSCAARSCPAQVPKARTMSTSFFSRMRRRTSWRTFSRCWLSQFAE